LSPTAEASLRGSAAWWKGGRPHKKSVLPLSDPLRSVQGHTSQRFEVNPLPLTVACNA
jgi:hypothetical protein